MRRGTWSHDLLEKDQQLVVPCSLQLTMCKCGCARIVSVPGKDESLIMI